MFGIKTKIRKIIYEIKHPQFIYGSLSDVGYPEYPCSDFRIKARLNTVAADMKQVDFMHNIGSISPVANRFAVKLYQQFISINPNNIGNWSIDNPSQEGTKRLEFEVIKKLTDLYCGDKKNIEGYITSGGTEGNLFGVWIGKTFVTKNNDIHSVCLLKTSLTHYSVDKACLMCSIKQIDVPLNPHQWTMDPHALELEIEKQVQLGMRGFIIFLTFGYTETGANDDLHAIDSVVKKLTNRYQQISMSIIIDAAFNGLICPFISNSFHPFSSKFVHAFSTDFTKVTAIPYPAGAVLYRKQLRKMIERKVPVFSMPDNTLLGSRPGASAAAIWGTMHHYGISGYAKLIKRQMEIKEYFISKLLMIFPDAEVISDPLSLACGVIFNKDINWSLPKQTEERYWMYAKQKSLRFSNNTSRRVKIYKFFFLSHITRRAVNEILKSIENSVREK